MGVDADFYLKGSWTDEQEKSFEDSAKERGIWDEYGKLTEYEDGQWLSFYSLSRYYGPGYERGYWPYIYSVLLLLKHHFPDAQVYYGGDSEPEYCQEMTDEALAGIWAHWLSPDGQSYHRSFDQFRQPQPEPVAIDPRLEIIAREILEDNNPEEIGKWSIYENGGYRQATKQEQRLCELGWHRKKNKDAQIVRTNGLSDAKSQPVSAKGGQGDE